MDSDLSTITALLAALSVASERLVEIVKNVLPGLREAKDSDRVEGHRQAKLQVLAIGAGVLTTYFATFVMTLPGDNRPLSIVALGVLTGGGSGFWNSVQTYVLKLKDLKKVQVRKEEVATGLTLVQTDKEQALIDLARRSIPPPT